MKKYMFTDKKVYIWVAAVCFLIMFWSIISDSGLPAAIKRYLSEPGYPEILREACLKTGISAPNNVFEYITLFFNMSYWSFDTNIIFGTIWFQIILPVFAAVAAFLFYNKLHSIYSFSLHKAKTHKNFFLKQIAKYSLYLSLAIFIGYLLFYVVSLLMTHGVLNDTATRELFLDLFGKNFYSDNVYLYHILEGIVRFFIMPFIYCFFGQSIALLAKNKIIVLLSPCLYYYGLAFLGFGLTYLIGNGSIYINPTAIMASGDYYNINTPLILLVNCIPLLIGWVLIRWRGRHVEL